MKVFKLLVLVVMTFLSPVMSAEEINGIIVSTAENPVYYTIKNMRAARMNYVDSENSELSAGDIVNGDGEVVGHDNAGGSSLWLPEFLWDGEPTPNIMDFPYMGLALVDNKFWAAFSAMEQCMDRRTTYWWFEKAKTVKNGVYIHNAVIDGALKKNAENVNGRPSMSFSNTAKSAYYVIQLTQDQMDNVGFEDEEFSTDAFAFSNTNKIADDNDNVINPNSCLDMNNYVTYNYEVDSPDETEEVQERDENGNLVFDEDGEPVMVEQPVKLKYGFVGVNRAWNPLNPGSNDNVRINNGSLFKVSKVEDSAVVEDAIESFRATVEAAYIAQAKDLFEKAKQNVIKRISCLKNVPELFPSNEVDAIIESITEYYNDIDFSYYNKQEKLDLLNAEINKELEEFYNRALALAGDGTIITLQQMLAIQDWPNIDGSNVGNDYLSSNGIGFCKYDGSMAEIGYPAVTCVRTPDTSCAWTLEWVPYQGYKLKNGENYIRRFGNWNDLEELLMAQLGFSPDDFDDEETIWHHLDSHVMSWALTTDPELAAIFTFSASDSAIQNEILDESSQSYVDSYGEGIGYNLIDEDAENYFRNTTNIVHIEAINPEGHITYLCRDNENNNYIVDSWNVGTRYFAASNCWKVKKIQDVAELLPPTPVEEINGIIISTEDNPVYYTITNMRPNRMSYVVRDHGNGSDYGGQIMSESGGDGEVIGTDGSNSFWLPEYLPNGDETPEIWNFPYMGLAKAENQFWAAFSAQQEVMDPRTMYWWFEKSSLNGGVYIHNAVIDGTLKKKTEYCLGGASVPFSANGKQTYYMVPITEEQFEELEFTDQEFKTNAFAISKSSRIADVAGKYTDAYQRSCLDVNNYITYNYEVESPDEFEEVPACDEYGDPIYDETGEPVWIQRPLKMKYGFAGMNLAWNPLNPAYDNARINNGALFKVSKVENIEDVKEAIESYRQTIEAAYREQAQNILNQAKEAAIDKVSCFRNVPEMYNVNMFEKLETVINDINNMKMDFSSIKSQEDLDLIETEITNQMHDQYLRALALCGDGTVITLQQMLALRDWSAFVDGYDDNVGNSYLSASGAGIIRFEGWMEEIGYPALTCLLSPDETCYWTMEWVPNQGYRLKNGENYIRQFGNWDDMLNLFMVELGLSADDFDEDDTFWNHVGNTDVMSWALTSNSKLAAIFTFSANKDAIQNVKLSDYEQDIVDTYGEEVGYDIYDEDAENYVKNTTNIIHLESTDPEGIPTYLCRDTASQEYIVDSWRAGNRYFASPNCWKIKKIFSGEDISDGIVDIYGRSKSTGIYDLQGRRFSKPSKGLYIINGVKTLIK